MTPTGPVLILLMATGLWLPALIHSFKPLFALDSKSVPHRVITQRAVLRKTAEVCRDMASDERRDFNLTIDNNLTAYEVQKACSSVGPALPVLSSDIFQNSIVDMYLSNAAVDVLFVLSAARHFDNETFEEGRDLITSGLAAVKASVKRQNFVDARLTLGTIFHTLQDFYSHSNWVELGNTAPYSALIRADETLQNVADHSTPTCRNCSGGDCNNNLLPELQQQGLLTSGYFSILSSAKPAGKCSHGGTVDRTSRKDPVGGISKDNLGSSHGSLHLAAADLAVSATMELLEDVRLAVGDKNFLRLMGLSQSSVLSFVVDTSSSMREVKRVSFNIIDSKKGTQVEPSVYILVPFNNPDFGPLTMTTNSEEFKDRINKLSASGRGDIPEKSLSGLQLALTAAPPSSEIFVFTGAPAKDAHLKGTISALIESTKSVVTFMLTGVSPVGRRRSSTGRRDSRAMSQADVQLYRELSWLSGGQTITVTESDLTVATSMIVDSSAGAVVTVFHVMTNSSKPGNFPFTVDGSLKNVTLYITGASSLTYNLISPSGVTQNSSQSSGPLATSTVAGNLHRLSLNTGNRTGEWQIRVDSNRPYSVKVTGQSSVNFIFRLVEAHEGAHGDFSLKETRPLSGGNVNALVLMTGSDAVNVSEVTLFDGSGPTQVNGSVQSMGDGNFLVRFISVPAGDYVVGLRGESGSGRFDFGPRGFQRQASTAIKTSSISVTTQANNTNVEPGSTVSVHFTIAATTNGVVNASDTGTFTVRVNNDRKYSSDSPGTVTAVAGTANGTVTLTVPSAAASGTSVTLTIEVENAASGDVNYAVLRFSVAAKVTDTKRPVCEVVSSSANCPSSSSLCSSAQWEFVANFTDGVNGSGIERVAVRKGNGTLNTSTAVGAGGENVTTVTYSASCCSGTVELTAVDGIGNVGTCVGQARQSSTETTLTNATSTGGRTLSMSHCLWVGAMVFFVLK